MANGIAVYAAIVATLALAWEIFRWWRDREPKLEIDLSTAWSYPPPDSGVTDGVELLVIEVRNRDATRRANVTSVGYGHEYPDGQLVFRASAREFEGATLPGVIEPNDAGLTSRVYPRASRAQIKEHAGSNARVFGWAWTSTALAPLELKRYLLDRVPQRSGLQKVPQPPINWSAIRKGVEQSAAQGDQPGA